MSRAITAVLVVFNIYLNVNGQQEIKSRNRLTTNTASLTPSLSNIKSLANVVELSRANNKKSGRDQLDNQLQTIYTLNDVSAVQALDRDPTVPNLFSHAMDLQSAIRRQQNNINNQQDTIPNTQMGESIIGPLPIPKTSSLQIPEPVSLNSNSNFEGQGISDMLLLNDVNSNMNTENTDSFQPNTIQSSPKRQIPLEPLVLKRGSFNLANENSIEPKALNLNKRAIETPVRGIMVDNSILKDQLPISAQSPIFPGVEEPQNLFDTSSKNQFGLINQQVKDGLSIGNEGLLERAPMPMWLQQQIENTAITPNSVSGNGFNSGFVQSNTQGFVLSNSIPSSQDVVSNFDTRLPDIRDYTTGVDALNRQTNDFYDIRLQDVSPTVGDREIEQLINNVVSSVDQNSAQQIAMSQGGTVSSNGGPSPLPQPNTENSNVLSTQNWRRQNIVPPLNPNPPTILMQNAANQPPFLQTGTNAFSRTLSTGSIQPNANSGSSQVSFRQVLPSGQVLLPGSGSIQTLSATNMIPGVSTVGNAVNRQPLVATNQNLMTRQGGIVMPSNSNMFPNQATLQSSLPRGAFLKNNNQNGIPNQLVLQGLPQQGRILMTNNPNAIPSQLGTQRIPQQSGLVTAGNVNTSPGQISLQNLPSQGGLSMSNNQNTIPNVPALQGITGPSGIGMTNNQNTNPSQPLQWGLPSSGFDFANPQQSIGIQPSPNLGQLPQNFNSGSRQLLNIPTTPVDRRTAISRIQDALRRPNLQQAGRNDVSGLIRQLSSLLVNSNNARAMPNSMRRQNDSVNFRNENVVNRLLQSMDFQKNMPPGKILMIYPRGTLNNSTLLGNRDSRVQRMDMSSMRNLLGQLLSPPPQQNSRSQNSQLNSRSQTSQPNSRSQTSQQNVRPQTNRQNTRPQTTQQIIRPQNVQQRRVVTRSRSPVSRNAQTRARPNIRQTTSRSATTGARRRNNQSQPRRSRRPVSQSNSRPTTIRVRQTRPRATTRLSRPNISRSSNVRIGQRRAAA